MRQTRLLAAVTAAGFLLAPASAQAPSSPPRTDADPALWVVKDEDTTVYMFGTVHVLDGKSDWFNDEVRTAFDAAQEVTLEAVLPENPADLQPLVLKYALDTSGKKLSDRLSSEMKARLDRQLADMGVPAGSFEMFEPWFVASALVTLGAQTLGLTGEDGVEATITRAAKAAGKPIDELEGMEAQIRMLDEMPESVQLDFLDQTLESTDQLADVLPAMVSAWSSSDTGKLVALLNEGMDEMPELHRILFRDRNARWAEWIQGRLEQPGIVFMAVGAGHLGGKDSVQEMLAKRGIKSERVEH